MAIRIGDTFAHGEGKGKVVRTVESMDGNENVKLIVKKNGKVLRTRETVHLTNLMAQAHFNGRASKGTGQKLTRINA